VPAWADGKVAAKIIVLGREVCVVAGLHSLATSNFNLKKQIVLAEINFRELSDLLLNMEKSKFQELAKYPPVSRDLAFVLNEKVLYNEIKEEIIKFNPLLKRIELFDVYSGDKLETEEKSLAFHLTFQALDKTLTALEVDLIVKDLINHLHDKFAARLRD
jgi:phenylalanyl-tRNA synthetase beta chain